MKTEWEAYDNVRGQIVAGALIRRQVRRWLMNRSVSFKEDKGFIDSIFYLTGTVDESRKTIAAFKRLGL